MLLLFGRPGDINVDARGAYDRIAPTEPDVKCVRGTRHWGCSLEEDDATDVALRRGVSKLPVKLRLKQRHVGTL